MFTFKGAYCQWIAKVASGKGPRPKSSKSVKNNFRHLSRRAKTSKIVKNLKNIFDTLRQFSRGSSFPAPCGGALIYNVRSRPFYKEMGCPLLWSLAAPLVSESQLGANQGSAPATPLCKCRCQQVGHLQVRVAEGRRSTCLFERSPFR